MKKRVEVIFCLCSVWLISPLSLASLCHFTLFPCCGVWLTVFIFFLFRASLLLLWPSILLLLLFSKLWQDCCFSSFLFTFMTWSSFLKSKPTEVKSGYYYLSCFFSHSLSDIFPVLFQVHRNVRNEAEISRSDGLLQAGYQVETQMTQVQRFSDGCSNSHLATFVLWAHSLVELGLKNDFLIGRGSIKNRFCLKRKYSKVSVILIFYFQS